MLVTFRVAWVHVEFALRALAGNSFIKPWVTLWNLWICALFGHRQSVHYSFGQICPRCVSKPGDFEYEHPWITFWYELPVVCNIRLICHEALQPWKRPIQRIEVILDLAFSGVGLAMWLGFFNSTPDFLAMLSCMGLVLFVSYLVDLAGRICGFRHKVAIHSGSFVGVLTMIAYMYYCLTTTGRPF